MAGAPVGEPALGEERISRHTHVFDLSRDSTDSAGGGHSGSDEWGRDFARQKVEDPKYRLKLALVVLSELACFVFAGTIFGWPPLLAMLKQEGFYADLCSDGAAGCEAQEAALTVVYTCSAVAQTACAIVVGLITFNCGLRCLLVVGCVLEVIGLYLLLCLNSPVMLLPGLDQSTLVIGGVLTACGSMCFFQHAIGGISHFLPAKSFLITSISCTLFDASSAVFWFAKIAHGAGVALWMIGLFLMGLNLLLTVAIVHLRTAVGTDGLQGYNPKQEKSAVAAKLPKVTEAGGAPHTLLKGRSLSSQLCSLEFGFIMVYMAVHMTRSNLYLGILTPFFESIGGATGPSTESYITIATLIIPAGCLWVPVVEQIVDRGKGAGGAFVVHVLATVYGALMFIPSLQVQLVGSVIFGFYRALLFSIIAVFNIEVFGLENVAPINGIMYSSTTLFSFVIDPALEYANITCKGDYKPLLAWQFLAMVPSLAMTAALYARSREPFADGPRARVERDARNWCKDRRKAVSPMFFVEAASPIHPSRDSEVGTGLDYIY